MRIYEFISRNVFLLLVLVIISLSIRIPVLLSAGEMFDEIAVAGYGQIYWGAIKNLDFSEDVWKINYEHPPVAKYIYGLGAVVEKKIPFIQKTFDAMYHPDKRYFLARFFSAILGTMNITIIFLIGSRWLNKQVGFFSALFLALMPHFIAHNAIAGLETPQALFSTLLVYLYVEGLRTNKTKYLFGSFAFFALLFLTKFSGLFFILFYLGVLALFRKNIFKDKDLLKVHILGALMFLVIVYFLWPWLWKDPLNIFKSFRYFRNAHSGEYFMGGLDQPPWYYYFAYFYATTPPAVLFLFLVGIVSLFLGKVKSSTTSKLYLPILLIWFLVPFVASFLGLKQDGVRYVFAYFPPLVLLAGYGMCIVFIKLKSVLFQYLIVSIVFGAIIWSLARFFPYYLDYYNIFVGGVRSVYNDRLFDYDWWGEGVKESVLKFNDKYENVSVLAKFHPIHTAPLFDEDINVYLEYDLLNPPDYILISEYRFYYNEQFPYLKNYKWVDSVSVNGVPLIRVYKKTTPQDI